MIIKLKMCITGKILVEMSVPGISMSQHQQEYGIAMSEQEYIYIYIYIVVLVSKTSS